MRIQVRNMVCRNCVSSLRLMLAQLGFSVLDVGLGYADIDAEELTPGQLDAIDRGLATLGFDRIVDPARATVEKVKHAIIEHVSQTEPCQHNLSECISRATGQDYKSVSRLFSAVEGRTIEKFYISARIEKAKELLSYGDLNISEIAYRLGYSSVAFLSRQFKQETGLTPTQFQKSHLPRRPLTEI